MSTIPQGQVNLITRSIYLHISGATGAHGHLNDHGEQLNLKSLESKIGEILNSPQSHFFINNTNNLNRKGTVTVYNKNTKNILILNPQQLRDPKYGPDGKIAFKTTEAKTDNLIGTFYRVPPLNKKGNPTKAVRGGQASEISTSKEHFKFQKKIETLIDTIHKETQDPNAELKIHNLANKSDRNLLAERIQALETPIRDALVKGMQRIKDDDWSAIVYQKAHNTISEQTINKNQVKKAENKLKNQDKIEDKSIIEHAKSVLKEKEDIEQRNLPKIEEIVSEIRHAALEAIAEIEIELAQELKHAVKIKSGASRLGVNATGAGIALASLAFYLTRQEHQDKRDLAADILAKNNLTPVAYEAYIELNKNLEQIFYNDLAISTADQTGLTGLISLYTELQAKKAYQEWADSYAQHLSDQDYENLSLGLFKSLSARSNFLWDARKHLPQTTDNQPEHLHKAIELTALHQSASKLSYSQKDDFIIGGNLNDELQKARQYGITITPANTPDQTIKTLQDALKNQILSEMNAIALDPNTIDTLLSTLPIMDRLNYAQRLFQSEKSIDSFKQNHPELHDYFQENHDTKIDLDPAPPKELAPLLQKPQLINQYIEQRTTPETPIIFKHDFQIQGSTYSGNFPILNALEAGIPISQELLPHSPINPTAPKTQPPAHSPIIQ